MSALPYQPVPTIAQRRALAADHAKRYRDNQAIADFQAARLRYELARLHNQPSEDVLRAAGESCCGTDEDAPPALFGLVDIWRSEFGAAWPLWIGGWTLLLAAGAVSFVALVWSYFHG